MEAKLSCSAAHLRASSLANTVVALPIRSMSCSKDESTSSQSECIPMPDCGPWQTCYGGITHMSINNSRAPPKPAHPIALIRNHPPLPPPPCQPLKPIDCKMLIHAGSAVDMVAYDTTSGSHICSDPHIPLSGFLESSWRPHDIWTGS